MDSDSDTYTTIRPSEAAHFGALATDWWDPKGSSAMLHRLNPVRLGYIRAAVNAHFGAVQSARRPLAGRRAIDVGCGAGLLTEPLSRLGAAVTGIDAAAENIGAAQTHAAGQRLPIEYICGDIADASLASGLGTFDLVTSLEVLEHVSDPRAFLRALASLLTPDGMMILSTPNRTAASRLLLVGAAEAVGAVPRGTHHWDQFVTPDELRDLANAARLRVTDVTGVLPDLTTRGFKAGGSTALDYLVTLVRDCR